MNTTRKSKISRLPKSVREELNRRLEDGESGPSLVKWLNESPEVRLLLPAEFAGQEFTPQNLSRWRQGGYQDWLRQQHTLELVRNLSGDTQELLEAGDTKSLTDQISISLAARFAVIAHELATQKLDPANWRRLRELSRDVVALRRGDHAGRWLKIAELRATDELEDENEAIVERFKQWAKYGRVREWLQSQDADKAERNRRLDEMFGMKEYKQQAEAAAVEAAKIKVVEEANAKAGARIKEIFSSSSDDERENRREDVSSSSSVPSPHTTAASSPTPDELDIPQRTVLPLPLGEGRGEGLGPTSSSLAARKAHSEGGLAAPKSCPQDEGGSSVCSPRAAADPTTPSLHHSTDPSSGLVTDHSAKKAIAMKPSERFLTPILRPPELRSRRR